MISPYVFAMASVIWLFLLTLYTKGACRFTARRFDFLMDVAVPTLEEENQKIRNNVLLYVSPFCLENLKEFMGFQRLLPWLMLFVGATGSIMLAIPDTMIGSVSRYLTIIIVSGTIVGFISMRRSLKLIKYSVDVVNTLVRGLVLKDLPTEIKPPTQELEVLVQMCEKKETWETIFNIEKENENTDNER